eukprot:evm.model.scf_409.1 EVM.evm.TU.scf_409.1   scf_409:2137-4944(-)
MESSPSFSVVVAAPALIQIGSIPYEGRALLLRTSFGSTRVPIHSDYRYSGVGDPEIPTPVAAVAATLRQDRKRKAQGSTPLSGGTSSTSSTTPSSGGEWRRGDQLKDEKARADVVEKMEARRKAWEASEEAKFEEWRRQMELEFKAKMSGMEVEFESRVGERRQELEVESRHRITEMEREMVSEERRISEAHDREMKALEMERRRMNEAHESELQRLKQEHAAEMREIEDEQMQAAQSLKAIPCSTKADEDSEQKGDNGCQPGGRRAVEGQMASEFQSWQRMMNEEYERKRREVETELQEREERMVREREQRIADAARVKEEEAQAAHRERLAVLERELEIQRERVSSELNARMSEVRDKMEAEGKRELELLKERLATDRESELRKLREAADSQRREAVQALRRQLEEQEQREVEAVAGGRQLHRDADSQAASGAAGSSEQASPDDGSVDLKDPDTSGTQGADGAKGYELGAPVGHSGLCGQALSSCDAVNDGVIANEAVGAQIERGSEWGACGREHQAGLHHARGETLVDGDAEGANLLVRIE